MATGWAREGAEQDQIDATIKDGIKRAQSRLPSGESLESCAACGARFTGRADAETPPAPRPPPSPAARASYTPRERAAPPPRRAPPPEPEVVEADWVEREEPAPWPPVRGRGPGESGRPPTLPFPAVRVDVGSVLGCLARLALLAVALVVVVLLWFFGYCGTSIGFAATPTGASAGVTTEVPPAASAHGSVSLHVDATPTS